MALAGGPPAFELWEEHLAAYEVFCAVRGNWVVLQGWGRPHFMGLSVPAIQAAMWSLGIESSSKRETLLQVQAMEREARIVLND